MRRVPRAPGGNTAWAAQYGMQLKDAIHRQAHRSPRNLQVHLGPSELGAVCDREIVGKFAGEPITRHVISPWPSIVGTAVHSWLADAFAKENNLDGYPHWITEMLVTPHPSYPGRADLYDTVTFTLSDFKVLGPTSMAKVASAEGPPRRYVVQMLLYAKGYMNAGYRVDRVILAALPRTAPSLAGMYCWEHLITPADDVLISQVLAETSLRWQLAQGVMSGAIGINEIPITPSEACAFCDYFRPETAEDIRLGRPVQPGCPGNSPVT